MDQQKGKQRENPTLDETTYQAICAKYEQGFQDAGFPFKTPSATIQKKIKKRIEKTKCNKKEFI